MKKHPHTRSEATPGQAATPDPVGAGLGAALLAVAARTENLVAVTELDGTGIYLNPAGRTLIGLDARERGYSPGLQDLVSPEDLPLLLETLLPKVLSEGFWNGELSLRHAGAETSTPVRLDLIRIDDPETGKPGMLGVLASDIRRERAAHTALLEANRRRDELLGLLGHELRNPLAPVRNAVEILRLLQKDPDPRVSWALDVLERQISHLGRTLDELLDVSRIVRGKLKLELQSVAVGSCMRRAAEGLRPLLAQRRLQLEAEDPPAEVEVQADPVRFTQILRNLLAHAADLAEDGGKIRMVAETDDSQVRVLVSNDGPGLPPERMADLFEPLFSGSAGAPAEAIPDALGERTGFAAGLSVARRLTELLGGRLEATSAYPQPGSRFVVRLPQPRKTPLSLARSEDRVDGRIPALVVDDNPDVADALSMLLELLGCRVETAATGAEGLDAALRMRPRVAFLDIGLPDMDGFALAAKLRERLPLPGDPFLVAVTGYGRDEARERSLAAGFDEHLAKPVARRALQSILGRIGPPDASRLSDRAP